MFFGGRLDREEDSIFDLVNFEMLRVMPGCSCLCRSADHDVRMGVVGIARTDRMRREEDPEWSPEEL